MRRRSIGLVIAPALAVALGWGLLVVMPSNSTSTDLDQRLEATDAEVQSLAATMNESRKLEGAMSGLQADLVALERAMPTDADVAGVVRLVDRVADASGVTISLVSPQAADAPSNEVGSSAQPSDSFQVEVSGSATYSELIGFVDGLESSDRFVLITALGLEGGQGSGRLDVTLTFEVFSTSPVGSVALDPSVGFALDDSAPAGVDPGATLEVVSE